MISRHRQMFVSLVAAAFVSNARAQIDNPFVIIDIGTPPGMVPVTDVLTVTDINDDGAIVGYFPVSETPLITNGFYWYDGTFITFDEGDPVQDESTEIWGINDNHELVGWYGPQTLSGRTCIVYYDVRVNSVVDETIGTAYGIDMTNDGLLVGNDDGNGGKAWTSTPSVQELPDLHPGQSHESWATAVGGGDTPHVVGVGEDGQDDDWAIVWPIINGTATGPEGLMPPETEVESKATAANDAGTGQQATIVGYTDDGAGNLTGYIFLPNSAPDDWTEKAMPSMSYPMYINNHDEVVGHGPAGKYDARLYIEGSLTYDLSTLVQDWFPKRQVYTNQFEATVINDSGLIAGTGIVDTLGADEDAIVLLVPYDCDNDGSPDYRQRLIQTNPSAPTDWLLDECKLMRPGLQAPGDATPGNKAAQIKNVRAVRFITNQNDIQLVLTDNATCEAERQNLDNWGHNLNGYSESQNEIIVTIRTESGDPERDQIPDSLQEVVILDDIEEFCRRYARCIDYIQLGNEAFSGAGIFRFVNYGCPGGNFTGDVQDLPEACLQQGCDDIVAWLEKEAEAAVRGSALGGRPLQLIHAGIAYGAAENGRFGDANDTDRMESPAEGGGQVEARNRAAFAIDCVIDSANKIGAMVDLHMHFFDDPDSRAVAADIASPPGSTNWDTPTSLVCFEYGPVPSTSNNVPFGVTDFWWDHDGNDGEEDTKLYFNQLADDEPTTAWDEFPPADPPSTDTWVSSWLSNDPQVDLASGFITTGFNQLDSLGFRIVCYGPTHQADEADDIPPNPRPFELAALYAGQVVNVTKSHTRWREYFETAASPFAAALPIAQWTPHPEPCPVICPQ